MRIITATALIISFLLLSPASARANEEAKAIIGGLFSVIAEQALQEAQNPKEEEVIYWEGEKVEENSDQHDSSIEETFETETVSSENAPHKTIEKEPEQVQSTPTPMKVAYDEMVPLYELYICVMVSREGFKSGGFPMRGALALEKAKVHMKYIENHYQTKFHGIDIDAAWEEAKTKEQIYEAFRFEAENGNDQGMITCLEALEYKADKIKKEKDSDDKSKVIEKGW